MNSISEPFIQIPQDERVTRAVEEYLAAWETGQRPNRQEFLSRHADIADALADCLDGLDFIRSAAPDLREPTGPYTPSDAGRPEGALGDFRIVREIGRGGMGVVYEAEQISLGRRVALKVLPFASTLDSKQLQRFKNEAQAAAHLHHTNIVPVYATGCERGVHYYAMQFIEGQTLASIIADLRAQAKRSQKPTDAWSTAGEKAAAAPVAEQAAPQPPVVDSWATAAGGVAELPAHSAPSQTGGVAGISTEPSTKDARFFQSVAKLGIQAAEALEHAHELGVIHRDIKPANLLIESSPLTPQGRGVGGEGLRLWVTDFGLAHCQNQVGLTITGDLMGTLRYMSPEQALAKRIPIDHRTDIYSLGVTLYELLTLEPVFSGRDRQELLQQIAFEEPRPPRRRNKSIPAELETIVLKSIEKNPAERYATAQELADDLRRFLEDRPIQAKRPSIVQRARKWSRRHKAVVNAVTVTLVAALSAGTVLLWRANAETQVALHQAQAARDAADLQSDQARSAVDDMYSEVAERWLQHVPHMQELERKFLDKALQYYKQFSLEEGTEPAIRLRVATAYERMGNIQFKLGQPKEAEKNLRTAVDLLERLSEDYPDEAKYRWILGGCASNLALATAEKGATSEAEQPLRRSIAIMEQVVKETPIIEYRVSLGSSYHTLGDWLMAQGRRREAEEAFQHARAIREKGVAEYPDEGELRVKLAATYHDLSNVLKMQGNVGGAEQALKNGLDQLSQAKPHTYSEPNLLDVQGKLCYSLGRLLRDSGRVNEAGAVFRVGLAIWERLASGWAATPANQWSLAGTLEELGQVLTQTGHADQAVLHLKRAVYLREQLTARPDKVPRLQEPHYLGQSYQYLGMAQFDCGQLPEAEETFRRWVDFWEKRLAEAPTSPGYRSNLAGALYNLASVLLQRGKLVEAQERVEQAITRRKERLEGDPKNEAERGYLGDCYYALADVCRRRGDHAGAARAIADYVSGHPNNWQTYDKQMRFLAECVGLAERDTGLTAQQSKTAVNEYIRKGKQSIEDLLRRIPDDAEALNNAAHSLITGPARQLRDPKRAVELCKKAVAKAPENIAYHGTLGLALYRAGDLQAGEGELMRSVQLRNAITVQDCYVLALIHWKMDKKGDARRLYDAAVRNVDNEPQKSDELREFQAEASATLNAPASEAEHTLGRKMARLEQLIKQSPDSASYRQALAAAGVMLADLLDKASRLDEEEKELRKTLEHWKHLAAKFNGHPYYREGVAGTLNNLGNLLKKVSRLAEAKEAHFQSQNLWKTLVSEFPKSPAYQRGLASSWLNLGVVWRAAKRPDEAQEAYTKAIPLLENLVARDPTVRRYQDDLDQTYTNLANLLEDGGQPLQAEQEYRRAVAFWEKRAENSPKDAELRSKIGGNLHNFAIWIAGPRGDFPEERRLVERAIVHQRAALEDQPKNATYRRFLRNHYQVLADVLLKLGDHAQAARAAAELPRISPEVWQEYDFAINFLVQCVLLAERDSKLSTEQRAAAVQEYSRQAKHSIDEGLKRIPDDAETLNNTAYFLTMCAARQLRDPKRAVELARRAVAKAPDSGMYHGMLGIALYRAGDYFASSPELQDAFRLRNANSPTECFVLAMINWQLGFKQAAVDWYESPKRTAEKESGQKPPVLNDATREFQAEAAAMLGIKESPG
jgi:serine/threonine protein kinase/Tfp pilus assembly protein PilF